MRIQKCAIFAYKISIEVTLSGSTLYELVLRWLGTNLPDEFEKISRISSISLKISTLGKRFYVWLHDKFNWKTIFRSEPIISMQSCIYKVDYAMRSCNLKCIFKPNSMLYYNNFLESFFATLRPCYFYRYWIILEALFMNSHQYNYII